MWGPPRPPAGSNGSASAEVEGAKPPQSRAILNILVAEKALFSYLRGSSVMTLKCSKLLGETWARKSVKTGYKAGKFRQKGALACLQ